MNDTEIKEVAQQAMYKQALLNSMSRLEKKIDGRSRIVKVAEGLMRDRLYEDIVIGLLLVGTCVYLLGQPW